MSNEVLVRKLKDKAGNIHEMVSDDNLIWTSCRRHENPLSYALAGLPGESALACHTGQGWERQLIKIGWPVWVTNLGYRGASRDKHTPPDVLGYILGCGFFEGLAEIAIANPNMTPALFHLALTRYPDELELIEAYRDHRSAVLLDEAVAVETLDLRLFKAVDLADVPRVVLERVLANPDIRRKARDLVSNPTCPPWIQAVLVKEPDHSFASRLVANPNATFEVLDYMAGIKGLMSDTLAQAAAHPNISLATLARLSQHHRVEVVQAASSRLADLMTQIAPEVEEVEAGLQL